MANLPLATLTAILLVFVGMHGCDSQVIFLTLDCPFYDPNTRQTLTPSCNAATVCSNGGTCCPLEHGAAECIARNALCPHVTVNTTGCSKKERKKECAESTACGESKGSCCLNTCGGTSCLDKKKSGECPAINTTPRFCPEMLITFSGTCSSDTNCAGKLKCCPQICRQAACIEV